MAASGDLGLVADLRQVPADLVHVGQEPLGLGERVVELVEKVFGGRELAGGGARPGVRELAEGVEVFDELGGFARATGQPGALQFGHRPQPVVLHPLGVAVEVVEVHRQALGAAQQHDPVHGVLGGDDLVGLGGGGGPVGDERVVGEPGTGGVQQRRQQPQRHHRVGQGSHAVDGAVDVHAFVPGGEGGEPGCLECELHPVGEVGDAEVPLGQGGEGLGDVAVGQGEAGEQQGVGDAAHGGLVQQPGVPQDRGVERCVVEDEAGGPGDHVACDDGVAGVAPRVQQYGGHPVAVVPGGGEAVDGEGVEAGRLAVDGEYAAGKAVGGVHGWLAGVQGGVEYGVVPPPVRYGDHRATALAAADRASRIKAAVESSAWSYLARNFSAALEDARSAS